MVLLNKWLTYFPLASVTNIILKGSQLIVQLIFSDKHKTTWRSQPSTLRVSKGKFSTIQCQYIKKESQNISRSQTFNGSQKPAITHFKISFYSCCKLCDDVRCESPGYNDN